MDLTRIEQTTLYAPASAAPFVFLRWDATGAPPRIPLADTWSAEGDPAAVGWYVFLLQIPSGEAARELEANLRGVLTDSRGLAWAKSPFALVGQVTIALDPAKRPVVAADAPVALPPEVTPLVIMEGLVVEALGDPAELAGLGMTDPGGDRALGLEVALAKPKTRIVSFSALLASRVEGDRSVKRLAAVQVDPLRPFDAKRTWTKPLGPTYALIHLPTGGYRLDPVKR